MPYGYGVWLKINNPFIKNITSHIAHATIMCNMTREEASKLKKKLKTKYDIEINGHCKPIGEKYDKDDDLKSCGVSCKIEDWESIKEKCSGFSGSIPENPHITFQYFDVFEKNFPFLSDTGDVVVADIKSTNPLEWKIIEN